MTCRSAPQPVTLEGHIEKVSFHNRENQFTIARFQVTGTDNLVTVLGLLPHPHPGSALRITGTWETHARYGQQLRIVTAETVLPATIDGIRQYLASGFVKGVGARTIARLVNHFQGETLAVIENAPARLSEVKGIGRQTAQRISEAWRTEHALRSLVRFLQENSVNTLYAGRIFAAYGAESISVLQNEPLRLAHDFPRIGFTIADAVMQHSGVPFDDPRRVESCILHLLGESLNEGNTFVPATDLAERCRLVFNLDEDPIATACRNLAEADEVVIEDRPIDPPQQAVYLAALHRAESTIAARIKALALISGPSAGNGPGPHRRTRSRPAGHRALFRADGCYRQYFRLPGSHRHRWSWHRQNHVDPLDYRRLRISRETDRSGGTHRKGCPAARTGHRPQSAHDPPAPGIQPCRRRIRV